MISTELISNHWADITAEKIIREKGVKELYTCASGITPSGTVHIGNFREIISVDLVVRALKKRGCNVRFIYSWDDYDVFRKVPKNMLNPEILETYLRKPITLVPDTTGKSDNYAHANEIEVEQLLPLVGINPQFLYQAERYRNSLYAEQIKKALEKKSQIIEILNKYRTEPLDNTWWPVAVFSRFTDKDNTTVLSWDGEYSLTYKDNDLNCTDTIDMRKTPFTKLHWRVDWPMRWAYENVDFEPAGKDHHSQGGSFDTSKQIVELFGAEAPVSFQYDFISIKGRGGKISSSSGEVVSLSDVLQIYTPEVTRYLFASTRPNTEFSISFDLDVLKIYEDYDNCERRYFNLIPVNEKKALYEKRIYELSQVDSIPVCESYQIPFRHLCNLLQIYNGDINSVILSLPDVKEQQLERLKQRCVCAWNWITLYAPQDFRFSVVKAEDALRKDLTENELKAVKALTVQLEQWAGEDEKDLTQRLYNIVTENEIDSSVLFCSAYKVLIGKTSGPKLALFIKTIGRERCLSIFRNYK